GVGRAARRAAGNDEGSHAPRAHRPARDASRRDYCDRRGRRTVTHEEAMALLSEYALGALEDSAELEAHLLDCPTCIAELASLLETTAEPAEAVEPMPLPASLRERVLTHGVSRPDAPAEAARDLRGSVDHRPGRGAKIVRLPARRPAVSNWLAAAAAVLLVFGGF